jgi:glycosyltransferase involved in cell wall biosynthesis
VTRRLLVIVPAKDEAGAIAGVVRSARSTLGCAVLVVDDGSTDATADLAAAAGAIVVSLPYNLGVGGAIRTGLHYARQHGYDRVVQLDGDGQHDAGEAVRLMDELDAGDADLVVGSRFATGYAVSPARRLMMRALSRAVSRRLGTKITDTTSGFRAMNRRTIDVFSRHYPVDYLSDTVEALLLASDAGLRVREIDVRMHQRTTGTPSSSSVRSVYHLVRLMLILLLHRLRRPLPKEISDDPA